MLSIVDRYLIKLWLIFFAASILIFVTLFVAVDAMTTVIRFEAETISYFRFYAYSIPSMAYQMLPVASLVAVVFVLSQLQKNNELVALYSLGMSLARVSRPLLLSVIGASVLGFLLADQLLPYFNQQKNYVLHVEIQKRPQRFVTVRVDKIWYRSQNRLYYLRTVNAEQAFGQDLLLFDFSPQWDLLQTINAETVEFQKDQWLLKDGSITVFVGEDSFPITQSFQKKTISVEQSVEDFQETGKASDILSQQQLARFIKRNKVAGLDTVRYEVDYHAKYSYAFASFVMALIGIPFSVGRQRSGGMLINIGLCMGLTVVYQALYNASLTLGRFDQIPAALAAWGPNLATAAFAWFLLIRLRQ